MDDKITQDDNERIKHLMDELNRRNDLLNIVHNTAAVLLAVTDEGTFKTMLLAGMEMIGKCANVNRIQIIKNELIDGKHYFVYKHGWYSDAGSRASRIKEGDRFPYSVFDEFGSHFWKGKCVNGPLQELPPFVREFYGRTRIKSLLIIPVFLQDQFWGLVSFDDLQHERFFTKDEECILSSGALMMVSAEDRNAQMLQLREANEYTELLLDAMPYSCNLWSSANNVFKCNMGSVRLLGLSDKQEFLEHFDELSPEYQPDGRLSSEVSEYHINKAFKEGNDVFEWMHQKRDGTPIPTEVTLVRVAHDGGYVVAAYVRDLREHLKMMESLETADQAKSDFLARVSHEMRTPLNAIIGLSELSLNAGRLNREDNTNLENINGAGMTLLSTVNDILDISKIEAGKFELIPAEYSLPSLINDAVTQSVILTGEKPIRFILNIDENLPSALCGDELRVKHIFNNLLSNAFKYTEKGVIEFGVSCARESGKVWMTAYVRDTGAGIREENIENLFKDYYQANPLAAGKIAGTGLGLPIAQRMAELMGGSISVESEYGKGSVFTVKILQEYVSDETIGCETADSLRNFNFFEQKRKQVARAARAKMPYASVLVVDDNITNLDVAKGYLKPYGMRIDCVTSGEEAIAAVRAEKVRYNAIFMDHMMPVMDGIEAAEIIRGLGTDYAENVPIIALTANAITGNEEMFMNKGFQAFISKPIDVNQLDDVVMRLVRDVKQDKSHADQNRRSVHSRRSGIDRRALSKGIEGLHIEKGIERFGGDEDSYYEVLRSFATNTPALLESAGKINRDNLRDYAVIVHGIKGSSRGISADVFADIAETLERAAKAGNYDFVATHNLPFLEAAWKLVSEIDEMLLKVYTDNPKPGRDSPDKAVLDMLLDACNSYDMDGVDMAIEKLECYKYESGDELVSWLKDNVERMNFPQIIERLTNLND